MRATAKTMITTKIRTVTGDAAYRRPVWAHAPAATFSLITREDPPGCIVTP